MEPKILEIVGSGGPLAILVLWLLKLEISDRQRLKDIERLEKLRDSDSNQVAVIFEKISHIDRSLARIEGAMGVKPAND